MPKILFRDGKVVFRDGKIVFTDDPAGCSCCDWECLGCENCCFSTISKIDIELPPLYYTGSNALLMAIRDLVNNFEELLPFSHITPDVFGDEAVWEWIGEPFELSGRMRRERVRLLLECDLGFTRAAAFIDTQRAGGSWSPSVDFLLDSTETTSCCGRIFEAHELSRSHPFAMSSSGGMTVELINNHCCRFFAECFQEPSHVECDQDGINSCLEDEGI